MSYSRMPRPQLHRGNLRVVLIWKGICLVSAHTVNLSGNALFDSTSATRPPIQMCVRASVRHDQLGCLRQEKS